MAIAVAAVLCAVWGWSVGPASARTLSGRSAHASATGSSWSGPFAIDTGHQFGSVSCPTTSFCVAVDSAGNALTFDGSSWSAPTNIDGQSPLASVSCASESFCVTGDPSGNVLIFDGSSWSAPQKIDSNQYGGIDSVSCPSASFCLAVAGNGDALTFDGSSWSAPASIGLSGTSVSCASASFCAAVLSTNTSNGLYNEARTYDGSSWSAPTTLDYNPYLGATVSCPSASFCAVVDDQGNAMTYDGSSWSAPTQVDANGYLDSLSCPSAAFCMAGDGSASVYSFDGSSWSAPTVIENGPTGRAGLASMSCATVSSCVAVDQSGRALVYSSRPVPPPGGSCQSAEVKFGEVDALGCFVAGSHGTWVSTGKVRVNGVDLEPHGGRITLDPTGEALHAQGSGMIRVGGVIPVPWVDGLDWKLGGKFTLLGKVDAALFGFRIAGSLTGEVLPDGEMQLMSQASMGVLGDPVKASVAITTSNVDGLAGADVGVGPADADPLDPHTMGFCSPKKKPPKGYDCVKVPTATGSSFTWRLTPPGKHPAALDPHLMPFCDPSKAPPIGYRCTSITTKDGKSSRPRLVALQPGVVRLGGILPVEGLDFSWDRSARTWSGEAVILLGDILPGPSVLKSALGSADLTLGATIRVNPFQLNEANAAIDGAEIRLGPAQLENASFDLKLHPRFAISGDASLSAGPEKAVDVSGGFEIKEGKTSGLDVKLHGSVAVKTITVTGYVEYDGTDGAQKVLLGGSFTRSWGPVSATLGIGGGIETNPFHFQLTGDGSIDAFGAHVDAHGIVSDAGVGACGEIHALTFSYQVGFKHFWSGETDFQGCDFGGLYTVGPAAAADALGTGRTVTIPRHQPRVELAVVGAGAAPAVTLTGPRGEMLQTPATPDKIQITNEGLALAVTGSKTTYFIIAHPRAGRWRIVPEPGTPAPVRYEQADPLQPLGLVAKVSGNGPARVLRWRLHRQRGVSVRFIQEGGTEETVADGTGTTGRARFAIAPGPGGVRKILAVVSIDGMPRETIVVARFRAAPPPRPHVANARARSARGTTTVTWNRLRGVSHYEVDVRLGAGMILRYRLPGGARAVKVRLPRGTLIRRITIQATSSLGLTGPAIAAQLQPQQRHPGRHR